jgi:hypothetical protein
MERNMKRVKDLHKKPAISLPGHVSANNAGANDLPERWVFSGTVYWFDYYPARSRRMQIAWSLFL